MTDAIQREIEKNYEFFVGFSSSVIEEHRGEYALLRSQECVAIYPTLLQAVKEASRRFVDGKYSIQEVADGPVDLGFFSHADNPGDVR